MYVYGTYTVKDANNLDDKYRPINLTITVEKFADICDYSNFIMNQSRLRN